MRQLRQRRTFVCAIENDGEERGWKNLPAFAIIDQAAADSHTFNKGELASPEKASPASKRLKSSPMHAESTSSPFSLKFPVTTKTPRWDWIRISNEVRTTTLNNRPTPSKGFEGAARTLAPLTTPPFYAAEIVPVLLGTMGGIKVDSSARALDTDGKIISRLYAQGNCAGVGAGGSMYVGGGGTRPRNRVRRLPLPISKPSAIGSSSVTEGRDCRRAVLVPPSPLQWRGKGGSDRYRNSLEFHSTNFWKETPMRLGWVQSP